MTQMLTNGVEEADWDDREKYGEGRSKPNEFRTLMLEEEKSHSPQNFCAPLVFQVEIFYFEASLTHSLLVILYRLSFTAQFKPLF
jgi:hypothetical protein